METKQTSLLSLLVSIALTVYITPVPTFAFFIDHRQSPNAHHWSYTNQQDWPTDHKQCGQNFQSPIDIQRRYVIQNNQLKLHFYNYNQPTKFKISNAHHTIKLNPINPFPELDQFGIKLSKPFGGDESNSSLPDIISADEEAEAAADFTARNGGEIMLPVPRRAALLERIRTLQAERGQPGKSNEAPATANGNHIDHSDQPVQPTHQDPPYNGAPTIKLDWLDDGNNEYKLRDIHFHWGERRDNGSEHAIDGRRSAMEMHLVHIKHGLDKSQIGFTSDSVAVIAVLVESYRKSNADFNPIVNALTRINMSHEVQEIDYKSINDLLPNTLSSFYTYSGSLTTPPCYQVVNWIVMSDRLYLNAKQIEMFRSLYAPPPPVDEPAGEHHSHTPMLIMPNIRHIQPVNNRTILASFASLNRLEQIQIAAVPYSGAKSMFNLQSIYLQLAYQLLCAILFLSKLLKIDQIVGHAISSIYGANCVSSPPKRAKSLIGAD